MTMILSELRRLGGRGIEASRLLAVLLLYREKRCIGRIKASKLLGLSERVTRRLIDSLVEAGYLGREGLKTCITRSGEDLVGGIIVRRCTVDGGRIVQYTGLDECYWTVSKAISRVRDGVVILAGDPNVFEVIGLICGANVSIPGLPPDTGKRYLDLAEKCGFDEGVFVVWRKYNPYLYDAYIVHSILSVCGY